MWHGRPYPPTLLPSTYYYRSSSGTKSPPRGGGTPLLKDALTELGQSPLTPTFHLNEVQLVDGLQQRLTVQSQVKLCRHFRFQGAFHPLLLRHLDTLDQSI